MCMHACMREILVGKNLKERVHLEDLSIGGKIILEWILGK
jgi:hypothetical protein